MWKYDLLNMEGNRVDIIESPYASYKAWCRYWTGKEYVYKLYRSYMDMCNDTHEDSRVISKGLARRSE
jgi:hypothetical protein